MDPAQNITNMFLLLQEAIRRGYARHKETQVDVQNLQIKIFKNLSDNPKAPAFKGIITDPANEYAKVAEISLWYADDRETGEQKLDRNGNPFLTGKTQAPYEKKS